MISKHDAIRSSPRSAKDPESHEYAVQMVYVLRTIWRRRQFSKRDWDKEVAECEKRRIWDKLDPPRESLEQVLEELVGATPEEILRRRGANQHTPEVVELRAHGASGNTRPSLGKRNDRDYTLARLKRDGHDELLTAVLAGELSANAAAIEAGFRKPPLSQRPAYENLVHWWNKADAAARARFKMEFIDNG